MPKVQRDLKAGYVENTYFVKPFGEFFLITTEHGRHLRLSREEYRLLRLGLAGEKPDLLKRLEDCGIVLTPKNVKKVIGDFHLKKRGLFVGPSLHIVAITSRCNHRCPYCYTGNETGGKNMDGDTAKKIVDFILEAPSPAVNIEISGGEPLMNFDVLRQIVDYSREQGEKAGKKVSHSVVTNLTCMEDEMLKYLIENNVSISTSLDGPKELHDRNRKYLGGRSSYEDVVYWIDRIIGEYKYPFVGALPVVTRHSMDFGRAMVDEYLERNLDCLRLKYICPTGNAQKNWDKIGYTSAEYLGLWTQVMDYILGLNRGGTYINEGLSTILLKKILLDTDPNYVDLNMPCGAGIGQMTYNEKGDIYTCDEGRAYDLFCLGNVWDSSYRDAVSSGAVTSILGVSSGYQLLCDACPWKAFCGVCCVISYAQTGNIIPKLPLDFRCRIHKGMFEYLFSKLLFSKDGSILKKWAVTNSF